jgi:hypothetical protein
MLQGLLAALMAYAVQGQIANPTMYPVATNLPVKDFSIVLTFSETVQKGGSANLVVAATSATSDDPNKISVVCTSPTAKWFGKVVLVPVTSSSGLKSNTDQAVLLPSNCFKAYRAGSTTDVAMAQAISFAITTEDTSTCLNTGTPEIHSGRVSPGVPLSPLNGAWVTSPTTTKFDLYFTESLQQSAGSITIKETTSTKAASTKAAFTATAAYVTYDADSIIGRVQIGSATWFTYGMYELIIGKAAFMDSYNNQMPSMFGSTNYIVKVSTDLVGTTDKIYPLNCCGSSLTTNYTIKHKMVFTFKDDVQPGTGQMSLCSSWSPSSSCKESVTAATSSMIFLGKRVIVTPGHAAGAT